MKRPTPPVQRPRRLQGRGRHDGAIAGQAPAIVGADDRADDAPIPAQASNASATASPGAMVAANDPPVAMAAALSVLDRLLGVAVDKTARLLGPATLLDPWRGMHLDVEDVRRALRGDRVAPLREGDAEAALGEAAAAALSAPLFATPALAALLHGASLDTLDTAIAVIVLAPDIDLRYERIYGYLQDDIAARRPGPDLIANLLGTSASQRLRVMDRLAATAPLVRAGVLPASGGDGPALGQGLQVGAPWRDALTRSAVPRDPLSARAREGSPSADGRHADARAWTTNDLPPGTAARITRIVREAVSHAAPVRLVLHGPDGAGKYELARHLAHSTGCVLRVVDLRGCASAAELQALLDAEAVAARLHHGLPYLHGVAHMGAHDRQLPRLMQDRLADPSLPFVLSLNAALPCVGAEPWSADRIELQWPDVEMRGRCWSRSLAELGLTVSGEELAAIASRFVLSRAQIHQAAADLQRELRFSGDSASLTASHLSAAARRLCGDELARLAQRIRPAAGFGELVAAPEVIAQLREMCERVALRERVRRWCGDGVHRRAHAVNALFAGPSGTGKTLAAEIVAHALDLDLFRIDLSAVVSKYIGETEKNLDRVFAAAEHANAVLFFDEAEALFGKRSEVKDAHDRYANIEIAYLLQKIEQFDGVAILATNLKQNLDEAFTRRLTFCINFAFPEEAERLRLWQTLWPGVAACAEDVDFAVLARDYKLSGGNIRNVVTAALYLAAADGGVVTREHLRHATRREYQKFGKTLAPGPVAERRAA
jgi:hypothetical protein